MTFAPFVLVMHTAVFWRAYAVVQEDLSAGTFSFGSPLALALTRDRLIRKLAKRGFL